MSAPLRGCIRAYEQKYRLDMSPVSAALMPHSNDSLGRTTAAETR